MLRALWLLPLAAAGALEPDFRTSDRCLACHNGATAPSGEDVSIGLAWRPSIMANSARDPYWQASVRREALDHPEAVSEIEDECSICHMPAARFKARLRDRKGRIFTQLPFAAHREKGAEAEDGVTCSVCHQISRDGLGTRESFNGGFVVNAPGRRDARPEYGPLAVTPARQRIMDSSTGGFRPTEAAHVRDSALCGSCHQLYTTARGPEGRPNGYLAEQMPYLEWLHSDYPSRASCQGCHMPPIPGEAPVASVLGVLRQGAHRHAFPGANFLMQAMLNRYRGELDAAALPGELSAAVRGTADFLLSRAARLTLSDVVLRSGRLLACVRVENLTGHKLPTAYPSRRAWLRFVVRGRDGSVLFESGALRPDGSIVGNDNDADPGRLEPHYREITSSEQVQLFEPILADAQGRVTTGLISAVGYLKDNRVLPTGFDKRSVPRDISVAGAAAEDPDFQAGSALTRYSIPIGGPARPFSVEAELWYQPIGFRWAHNLDPYPADETRRFTGYYRSMSSTTAIMLARDNASVR